MAKQQIAILVAQMEAVSAAVAEHFAVGADAIFHPRAVAELIKSIVPHVQKIVFVDFALRLVGANAGAGRD